MSDMSNTPNQGEPNKDSGKDAGKNNEPQSSPSDDVLEGALIRFEPGETPEDTKITAAIAGTATPTDDGFEMTLSNATLNRDEIERLGITDPSGVFRAFYGDQGPGATSVGYSPRYSKNWESIFGKPENNN